MRKKGNRLCFFPAMLSLCATVDPSCSPLPPPSAIHSRRYHPPSILAVIITVTHPGTCNAKVTNRVYFIRRYLIQTCSQFKIGLSILPNQIFTVHTVYSVATLMYRTVAFLFPPKKRALYLVQSPREELDEGSCDAKRYASASLRYIF